MTEVLEAPINANGNPEDSKVLVDLPHHYPVTFDQLRDIEVPEATKSHHPIPYTDQILQIYEQGDAILGPKGFRLDGEQFIVGAEGNRLFFVLEYANSDTHMKMAIAGRTSYDKSMIAARAIGARVVICVNLCIWGGVSYFHKHTQNGADYLEDQTILTLYRATREWDNVRRWRDNLAEIPMTRDQGIELMGLAKTYTRDAPSPTGRLLSTNKEWDLVTNEWTSPTAVETDMQRTLWHWYNAFTFTFKDLKPEDQLPRHAAFHQFVMDNKHRLPT